MGWKRCDSVAHVAPETWSFLQNPKGSDWNQWDTTGFIQGSLFELKGAISY